ncbi:MAG: hypothetical protein QF412_12905 [Planctomycetota bacterium]|nr:hypothetical protein [Planctomycetota bacterium]
MLCLAWVLSSLAAAPQESAAVTPALARFHVENRSSWRRQEIARVSIPFARGERRQARRFVVDGVAVPAVTLIRWPDDSVAVAQVHVPMVLDSGQEREVLVHEHTDSAKDHPAFKLAWHLQELAVQTEVVDPWGRVFVALLQVGSPVPPSSDLVRVRPLRGVHRHADAGLLEVRGWLTTFRGERRAELTILLDNGMTETKARAPSLGPLRLSRFAMVTPAGLRVRPRHTAENLLKPPEEVEGGGFRHILLGPSEQSYLGDRTGKAYRFDLFLDGEGVGDGERESAMAVAEAPLRPVPGLDCVRESGAFSAHGGPGPGGLDRTVIVVKQWHGSARFGPMAGHGDSEDSAAQGTPRNGPSALHNAVRWHSAALLDIAETMVLQQCLRPTPGRNPRLPEVGEPWRQGLSARAIARPHGWTPLDYEHVSVNLLYDWFWLTGDPLARDELRRVGTGLRRLLEHLPFMTSRGEGWCLQAGVLIARATGEDSIVKWLAERFRQDVLPVLGEIPEPFAISQPAHESAFGPGVRFDAPWQMAALVHGLHAIHAETGDDDMAAAAVRVARIMAGPGWLEGVGPKYLVSATDAARHSMPVGHGPLHGTAVMEVGAFVLAADLATSLGDGANAGLFRSRAATIARAQTDTVEARSNVWMQLWLDRGTPSVREIVDDEAKDGRGGEESRDGHP